jgi:hypothetical protein
MVNLRVGGASEVCARRKPLSRAADSISIEDRPLVMSQVLLARDPPAVGRTPHPDGPEIALA